MGQDQSEAGRWKWVKDIIVPTLVALVAFVGTFLGSFQANNVSRETQRNQISEEHAKADRERRAEVYLKFLSTAREYAAGLVPLLERCRDPEPPGAQPNAPSVAAYAQCQTAVYQQTTELSRNYYAAQNEVYIFGSDDAAKIAERMTAGFPERKIDLPGGIPTSGPRYGIPGESDSTYRDNYEQFQQMACREIPANPRAHC